MTATDRCPSCNEPHLFRKCVVHDGQYVYFCSNPCRKLWIVINKPNGQKIKLVGLALTFFLCLTYPAQAEWDGEEGAMSEWFKSLQDGNGRSCCGMGDYHRVNYRGKGDGVEIEWNGQWYTVPEIARVKNYANPTGEGAAFFYEDATGAPREIFCFIRAVEG